jgi:hypothetical protein
MLKGTPNRILVWLGDSVSYTCIYVHISAALVASSPLATDYSEHSSE